MMPNVLFDITYRRKLFEMPSIAEQMPVVFDNGNGWEDFDGYCGTCDKEIKPDLLRGSVTKPFSNVAVLHAVGVCQDCDKCTCYNYRLYPDMRISGIVGDKWAEWKTEITLWDRLFSLLTGKGKACIQKK